MLESAPLTPTPDREIGTFGWGWGEYSTDRYFDERGGSKNRRGRSCFYDTPGVNTERNLFSELKKNLLQFVLLGTCLRCALDENEDARGDAGHCSFEICSAAVVGWIG